MISDSVSLYPEQATTVAAKVDELFFFLVSVCGAMGLFVACLLIYFCVRYRRRPGREMPTETRQSHLLEWFWTLAPLPVFLIMFLWGAEVYTEAYRPPDDAMRIYGIGKQWMWKFQHPQGQREIDTLHLPKGRPVQILLTSEDVIHSFFVPEFRVHMDVLPNRYTSVWFQPTKTGEYHLFCSQYCGTDHAGMRGTVIVMEPADYQAWLQNSADGSLAFQGRSLFLKYRCLSCHSANANASAPVLEGVFGNPVRLSNGTTVTADASYIRESLVEPSAKLVAGWQNIMPTFRGQLDEEEIYAIIAYLRTLKAGETPDRIDTFPRPTHTPSID